jgi:RNA polymerase sigma-70 factor (ECF subfamily)
MEIGRHLGPLRRYARALMKDRTEADDLVQDSVARALSRAHCFQPGTNLRAWLFTIMHNVHVNTIRQRVTRPEGASDEALGRLVSPANQDDRVELRDMARALDTLPPEQRQVLLLVALEGLKYDEVATVLEVPVGTVMSRLSRAREALRRQLSGQAPTPLLRRVK